MNKVIKVINISKDFKLRGNRNVFSGLIKPKWKYKKAVNNISFEIAKNEAVAFLGPNGAGKTTTTKMMTGLIKPSSGRINVLGYLPFDKKADFLKSIGLVMGNKAGLNWDLTALQSFELLKQIYDVSELDFNRRLNELVTTLKVDQVLDKQVRKLSLGERMKLEVIGSLLHDPEILFLDEPTIGLDITSKNNMRKFLRELHAKGKTIILTSHDMDDIAEVCDRVIIINNGELVYDGSVHELNNKYSSKRYIKLEYDGDVPESIEQNSLVEIIKIKKSLVELSCNASDLSLAITQITNNVGIKDITIESTPLEIIINDMFKATSTT